MLNLIKKLLPTEFRQKLKRRLFQIQDMQTRLMNLRHAGFRPFEAIEGGANIGE